MDRVIPSVPSSSIAATRAAALACIARIEAVGPPEAGASPAAAVTRIARQLAAATTPAEPSAWIVRREESAVGGRVQEGRECGKSDGRADVSAWRHWLRGGSSAGEWPLLYLLRGSGADVVRASAMEGGQRGIFCNDIETLPSRWPKGTRPELSLWLASHSRCLPYDPASGAEATAIVLAALRRLYVHRRPGFVYLSAHGDEGAAWPALDGSRAAGAFRGMYLVEAARPYPGPQVRLLGAGKALRTVTEAARRLRADWQVGVEVWSCPSYTRLAREAEAAARWNRLHPLAPPRSSHLQRCLPAGDGPVIALTGYGAAIARQIGPYLADRFVALGVEADFMARQEGVDVHDPHWIAAIALKALADERVVPAGVVAAAMRRYRLAGA
jgi:pyruvate dehydrogenase E1 component